jgi:hypothetical protein
MCASPHYEIILGAIVTSTAETEHEAIDQGVKLKRRFPECSVKIVNLRTGLSAEVPELDDELSLGAERMNWEGFGPDPRFSRSRADADRVGAGGEINRRYRTHQLRGATRRRLSSK